MVRVKKRIVVLGGGFAGIECARKLEVLFRNDYSIEIVLVSEDNFLLFTPLLPQVASGMIETRHAITSIRTILDRATFYEGRIKNIDQYGNIVTLWGTTEKRGISIHYDYLILALGSQTNFFGGECVCVSTKSMFLMSFSNAGLSCKFIIYLILRGGCVLCLFFKFTR